MIRTEPSAPVLRDRFANLEGSTYLISHSMGAAPLAAREALVSYWNDWSQDGPEAWERWLPQIETIAAGIGSLLGAPSGTIALGPNVSAFQETIASALDFSGERCEVVYEALQFPTVTYVWDAWQRHGAHVVCVPSDDGMTIPTERIAAAITERTALVVLSHAYYVSGALVDVAAIVKRARDVGAMVMLDGGSHKWLCGGPGCGFLYVRADRRMQFAPAATGWMAHAAPFAFEPAPMRYADSMMRYTNGTPSMLAYLVAAPGHALIAAVGLPAIRAHNIALTTLLLAEADARGIRTPTPRDPAKRSGWIGLAVPDGARITQTLIERRIFVDYRPGCGIRIGPHFYTTADEILALFGALDELMR
jgi:kynureninase